MTVTSAGWSAPASGLERASKWAGARPQAGREWRGKRGGRPGKRAGSAGKRKGGRRCKRGGLIGKWNVLSNTRGGWHGAAGAARHRANGASGTAQTGQAAQRKPSRRRGANGAASAAQTGRRMQHLFWFVVHFTNVPVHTRNTFVHLRRFEQLSARQVVPASGHDWSLCRYARPYSL